MSKHYRSFDSEVSLLASQVRRVHGFRSHHTALTYIIDALAYRINSEENFQMDHMEIIDDALVEFAKRGES